MHCAVDQIYLSEEVAVVDLCLGEKTSSDHLRALARIRIDPDEGKRLNAASKPLRPEEQKEIDKGLQDSRWTLHPEAGPSV